MGYANWIMVKHDTPDKPELWEAAKVLNLDPDAILGKMIRVWIWFDTQTIDGNALSVTKMLLDREVGVTGFCDVMVSVGWMIESDGKLLLPNFDRHNGETAKKRAQSNRRVAAKRKRDKEKSNASGVTSACQKALPEEEEEEDKKKDSSTKSRKKAKPKVFMPPDVSEVATYCAERNNGIDAEAFVAHYESCGWVIGQGSKKMTSWKAAVITWEKNRNGNGSGKGPQATRGTAAERNQQIGEYLDAELRKEVDGT